MIVQNYYRAPLETLSVIFPLIFQTIIAAQILCVGERMVITAVLFLLRLISVLVL